MCGIAGVVNADPEVEVDEAALSGAVERLRHRGPDGCATWTDPGAGLGHTRLAIIDRAHGAQPMFTADGRYAVVFNGEIYNHHALRAELVREGHPLATHCDTEVLPYLYAAHGPEMLGKLRGMFAFAIYDRRERTLLVARDPFGKKPVYLAEGDGRLAFASTLDALAAVSGGPFDLDPQSLFDYLVLQYVPSPRSPLAGATKLAPGSFALWRDGRLTVDSYRRPPARTTGAASPPDPGPGDVRRLREAIADAVAVRLESEVPLGIFLSGGMDSSVVVAEAAAAGVRPRTFSVGFRSASFDETRYAQAVAERFGTDHRRLVADVDVPALFDAFVAGYDEPFADSSALATLAVARTAADHVTVVLTGDGGDEMFGGYRRYQWFRRGAGIRRALGPLAPVAAGAARAVGGAARVRALRAGGRIVSDPWTWYRDALFHFQSAEAASLLRPELRSQVDPEAPVRRLDALWGEGDGSASSLMLVDEQTYLPDDLMTKMDRATMAFSLEARTPLLDPPLAELCAEYPSSWVLDGRDGKRILRTAYAGVLPDEILTRPKKGFGVPIAAWMRGELRPAVDELLLSASSPVWGWLRYDEGSRLVRDFLGGDDRLRARVWNLLALAGWAGRRAGTVVRISNGEPAR